MSDTASLWQRLNLRSNVVFGLCEFSVNTVLLFVSYRIIILQGGLEALGVWATLYAWTNLARLGDAGVAAAAPRFLALWNPASERATIRRFGETAIITSLAQYGVLASICYAALAPFTGRIVSEPHQAEAAAILPYMIAGFFLLNVSGTTLGILQGLHLGYRRSQLSVLGTSIQLGGVIVLVPQHGLLGLAVAQILQHSVVATAGWAVARREMGGGLLPTRFDRQAFRAMLGFSLRAQAVNIANGLVEPVSKMLVGHFGGMATLALFELAYKTVLLPRNLVGAGISAAVPALTALYQEGREEARRLYARMFRLALAAMAVATIGLIAVSPVLSWFWLQRVDETYWLYVALISAGFFFNGIGMPAYLLGAASGHQSANLFVALITLVCLIPMGYILGVGFGVAGCVLASAGAIGFSSIVIWVWNRKLLRYNANSPCASCT